MKKSLIILVVFILSYNLISAQENLFEKTNANTFTQSIKEKIERFKTREAIKQWEEVQLKPNIIITKNFKGIFNIFDRNIEFEIIKDFGTDVNGVKGYKAELKEGGYALLLIADQGMSTSIWYVNSSCNFEGRYGLSFRRIKKKLILPTGQAG